MQTMTSRRIVQKELSEWRNLLKIQKPVWEPKVRLKALLCMPYVSSTFLSSRTNKTKVKANPFFGDVTALYFQDPPLQRAANAF